MSPRGYFGDKETKEEVKSEFKPELKHEVEAKAEPVVSKPVEQQTPLVIVSEVDAYINDRVKSQPKSLDNIHVKDIENRDGKHILTLPEDIENVFKRKGYAPRWINKNKRAIDHAIDNRGWTLVTRILFPEIKSHYYTANGVIERGDAILGFMPLTRAERLRRTPGERSNERIKNLPIEKWKDGGESYYKPSLTEEKDGESITSGVQPDRLGQT